MGPGKERWEQTNYILLRHRRDFGDELFQFSLFIPSLIALTLNIITNPFPYSTTAHDLYINHLVLVG